MLFAKPENTRYASLSRKGKGGFTIVELIVSAVILIIAVIAVVAVVRKSTEIQVVDYHRRQARAVIMRTFETVFDYRQFGGPYNVQYNEVQDTTVEVNAVPVEVGVTVDERIPGVQPLTGKMTVTIYPRSFPGPAGAQPMAVHDVEIRVDWEEVDGSEEYVVLTKRLAAAQ